MKKYTDEQVIEAVKNSKSIRNVLMLLGLKAAGGNYSSIHNLIDKLRLDTSHFTGQGWLKGQKPGPKQPLIDYLENRRYITSHDLRLRLLKERVFTHKCQLCQRSTWLKQPIPLELDHIDGNHKNNNLTNLRLLCPNCHSLTPNYCRRKT